MKRFVYISETNSKNPIKMKEAEYLASKTRLSISIDHPAALNVEEIYVLSVPEKEFFSFQDVVQSNYVQIIDYTNEYKSFTKSLVCILKGENGKEYVFAPRLLEHHTVKFRIRLKEKGLYTFLIRDNENEYKPDNNVFEVI